MKVGAGRSQRSVFALFFAAIVPLVSCGGGGSPPPGPAPAILVRASSESPFAADCGGASAGGVLYLDSEVEPSIAVNPLDPSNLVGVWQQDRWSDGGARGLVAGASFDGGSTWRRQALPTARCAGGNSSNGGDFERASDPWVTLSPDGNAYALSLSFSGAVLGPGSASGMLVMRSSDGGANWSQPIALIADGSDAFNDKGSITADPTDARRVYAVWDRVEGDSAGPSYFARTTNGGESWEAAVAIHDPGPSSQTLGNQIVVLPDGTLLNLFTQIDTISQGNQRSSLAVIRSLDHGSTWSSPVQIAELLAVGAEDPTTRAPIRDSAGLGSIAVAPSGEVFVVWQDARFSAGLHDAIVLSRSTDAGSSWSDPVAINVDESIAAFTPSIAMRADGRIGVTYYDLRDDTAKARTLLTDFWLTESSDGVSWSESQLAGPFDLALAPDAEGLFLGDYQGLTSSDRAFVPLFVQTNGGAAANRTDVFVRPADSAATVRGEERTARLSRSDSRSAPTDELRRRVSGTLTRVLERRTHRF